MNKPIKLIILDLDNSLLCWCSMHTFGTKKSIEKVMEVTGIPYETLCEQHKDIITLAKSVEYPFAIQQLPSVLHHYKDDYEKLITECLEPAHEAYKLAAYPHLKPFPTVIDTLNTLKRDYPNIKLCVFTNAPLKPGMWRMYYTGIINYFDGIYGLENPRLPVVGNKVLVSPRTLLKHIEDWSHGFIGRQRMLPNDYGKPNTRGFKTILMDFEIEQYKKEEILFVGDNISSDITLAKNVNVTSAQALYGLQFDSKIVETLREFIPEHFIHKTICPTGDVKPDIILNNFGEILNLLG